MSDSNESSPVDRFLVYSETEEEMKVEANLTLYYPPEEFPGLPQVLLFPCPHFGSNRFYDHFRFYLNECEPVLAEAGPGPESVPPGLIELLKEFDICAQPVELPTNEYRLADLDFSVVESMTNYLLRDFKREGWTNLIDEFLEEGNVTKTIIYALKEARDLFVGDRPDCFKFIVDQRDAVLLGELTKALYEFVHVSPRVGVLFGPGHMPAVHRYLIETVGYSLHSNEWVTVLSMPLGFDELCD